MKRNSIYIIMAAAATMVLAACQKEEFAGPRMTDAVTRFDVSVAEISDAVDIPDTKAYMSDIPLSCKVMGGIALGSAENTVTTKASLINTTGDDTHQLSEYLTEFQVAAWEGTSGSTAFIEAYTKVKYQENGVESYWSTVNGSGSDVEYIWKKNAENKTFFAYANLPADVASVECPGAAGQTLTLTELPDKDILMGTYQGDGATGSPAVKTGTASIHFYHPLTAVRFKQGTLSDGVSVSAISIEGVYTSGKTTQTSTTETNFVWTKTDGSDFAATDETGTASLSNVTVDADSFIGDAIVLIPETFANADSRLVITLSTPTGAKTIYYQLQGLTFRAGFTNVFTIGYENEYIDVNINQSVVSGIARSLGVRNVGNENAYVRLAVTACWIDADGNILQGYTDFTAAGTPTGLNTTDWAQGDDGFYYYKKAIIPGKNTKTLFASFEPEEAPAEGLTFEMMVSVQAVGASYVEGSNLSDNAKTAWGVGIPVTDAIEE